MAGSRPLCLSGFSSSVLLLLWICHPGLVSLKTIYKKVGDTVEISSGLPTEVITTAKWKYNNETVSDIDRKITHHTFGNRLNFNYTTLSLTIKELTLQDSGNFSFISAQNRIQRDTVFITLLVQESITEEPILTSTHISRDSNQTCRVLVNCSLKSTSSVHYTLIFGNQIHNGSSNQYSIKKEGKGEVFTCTAHNHVSNRTTSKTVTCQDNSTEAAVAVFSHNLLVIVAAGGGGLLIIIVVVLVACCCRQKQEATDSTELTVYADVTDHHINKSQAACSLYDTIQEVSPTPIQWAPTVYDKIDFNRHLKPAVKKNIL